MQSWEWPIQPWSRMHIDYAGRFQGKMFLVVVDAHSKWMEVRIVNTATTDITIQKLRRMFATQRITPHTTTGQTPAQLLMGKCLRSHLDQLLPDLQTQMQDKQQRQIDSHNQHTKPRHFLPDATVFVRNFVTCDIWLPGIIIKAQGPRSYKVNLSDNRIIRHPVDHIRSRSIDSLTISQQTVTKPLTRSSLFLLHQAMNHPPKHCKELHDHQID